MRPATHSRWLRRPGDGLSDVIPGWGIGDLNVRMCAECAAERHGRLEPSAMEKITIARTRDEQTAKLADLVRKLRG